MPPKDLNLVQIAHSSCRKAHGETVDALSLLDTVNAKSRSDGTDIEFSVDRVHQLFLTGDQTYNDDVAQAMLAMCIDTAGYLMGSRKEVPPTTVGALAAGDWQAGNWPDRPEYSLPKNANFPWSIDGQNIAAWPGVGSRSILTYAAGFTVTAPTDLISLEKDPAQYPAINLKPLKNGGTAV